jgi:capsular exopolysaccharide synthesis family protein
MDLTAHLSVIFQRKWQVLAVSLLVAGLVFGWRVSVPKTYQAVALLNVTSARSLLGDAVTEQDARFIGQSYGTMAQTRPVIEDAVRRSDLEVSFDTADRRLSVGDAQPGYVEVAATGPSTAAAEALSQGLADALVAAVSARQAEQLFRQLQPVQDQIDAVEDELSNLTNNDPRRTALELQYQALLQKATETRLRPVDRVTIVTAARAEPAPVAPRPKRDALLAFFAALVVNAELAVGLAALSGRFIGGNVAAQVTRATGIPVLGEVPQGKRSTRIDVVEAFRTLRTNLLFLRNEGDLQSLAVVGGDPGSGKSFVAEHLSRAFARPGFPVLLMDGDLRNPSLHERIGVDADPGLADALAPPYTLAKPSDVPNHRNLRVLPAGSPAGDPSSLFSGKTFERLLERLQNVGLIVVDTPPLSLFADAAAVAQNCDSTIVVVDVRRGRRQELTRMIESLAQVGVVPVGIVLNRVQRSSGRNYGGYRSVRAGGSDEFSSARASGE